MRVKTFNFTEAYAISDSFKVKEKTAAKTDGNGTKMLKWWYN